jgi:hypothetical protein
MGHGWWRPEHAGHVWGYGVVNAKTNDEGRYDFRRRGR